MAVVTKNFIAKILQSLAYNFISTLEDNDLPGVPNIVVTLQPNYPNESSPQLHDNAIEYETSPFLKRVREALLSRMRKIPNRFTLTQLLTAWEMSVRSACLDRTPRGVSEIPFKPSISAV